MEAFKRASTLAEITYRAPAQGSITRHTALDGKISNFLTTLAAGHPHRAYAEIIHQSDARNGQFAVILLPFFAQRQRLEGVRVKFPDGEEADFRITDVRMYLLNLQKAPIDMQAYITECFIEEYRAMQTSDEKALSDEKVTTIHVFQIIDKVLKCIAFASFDVAENAIKRFVSPTSAYKPTYFKNSVMNEDTIREAFEDGALWFQGLCVLEDFRKQNIAQKLYTVAADYFLRAKAKRLVIFLTVFNVIDSSANSTFDASKVQRSHKRLIRYYRGMDFYPVAKFDLSKHNMSYTLMVSRV